MNSNKKSDDDLLEKKLQPAQEGIESIHNGENISIVEIHNGDDISIVEITEDPAATTTCSTICNFIKAQIKLIHHPWYFLLFNLIVVLQAVPAIFYYVHFFGANFYMVNTSGMNTVWGGTIGSFAATLVTAGLGPIPPGIVTKEFVIAIVVWEFVIFISMFIASICLGVMLDFNGMIWSIIAMLSGLSGGLFLLWFSLEMNQKLNDETNKKEEIKSNDDDNSAFAAVVPAGAAGGGSGEVELSGIDIDINIGSGNEVGENANDTLVTKESGNSSSEENKKFWEKVDKIRIYSIRTLLWLVLFVFYIIPAGFGIGQALNATDAMNFKMPGQTYEIPSTYNGSISIPIHLYCTGPSSSSLRPTILFEADFGMSGYSFYGLQQSLAALKWRSCSYDRPGYGWSNMAPAGTNSPLNYAHLLQDLLAKSNENENNNSNGYILIGHGQGSELMQIYATYFPDYVAGFVNLDGYPNLQRLLDISNAQIFSETKATCGNYQIGRCMEGVALLRPWTDYMNDLAIKNNEAFEPESKRLFFLSTFNNGKYWASLFSDYCIRMKSQPTRFTDYLNSQGTVGGGGSLNWHVKWPTLPSSIPVLIISASETVTKGQYASLYMTQANLYNTTLSPTLTSKWITCENCAHSFPYDHNYNWVAEQINSYFELSYPV